jgi:Flp pilus assembly protein TadD
MRYRDTHDPALVDPAKVACTRALELDKEIASAHVTLGMIYSNAGRSDAAEEELKLALGLNQRSAEVYSALAELYQKEGRASEVEPMIQKAIDLAPNSWAYINQLGSYYWSVGNNGGAVEQFQKAARLDPQNARALNQLGVTYRRQGRLDEARVAFEKSLAIEPAFNTISNLGFLLQLEGKNEEAAKTYQRAAEMNRDSYASWSNLASAYNRTPGGKAKAKETYLKAIPIAKTWIERHPTDAEAISDLGSFYAVVGDSEKSALALRQAAALAPANPQVLYRVAEGYELLGQRAEALGWIGKALQSGLSLDTVKRNPELAGLRGDPKFPSQK